MYSLRFSFSSLSFLIIPYPPLPMVQVREAAKCISLICWNPCIHTFYRWAGAPSCTCPSDAPSDNKKKGALLSLSPYTWQYRKELMSREITLQGAILLCYFFYQQRWKIFLKHHLASSVSPEITRLLTFFRLWVGDIFWILRAKINQPNFGSRKSNENWALRTISELMLSVGKKLSWKSRMWVILLL